MMYRRNKLTSQQFAAFKRAVKLEYEKMRKPENWPRRWKDRDLVEIDKKKAIARATELWFENYQIVTAKTSADGLAWWWTVGKPASNEHIVEAVIQAAIREIGIPEYVLTDDDIEDMLTKTFYATAGALGFWDHLDQHDKTSDETALYHLLHKTYTGRSVDYFRAKYAKKRKHRLRKYLSPMATEIADAMLAAESCHYCQGSCPNEPDDSEDLCDGFAGDIDGLYAEQLA